MNEEQQYLYKKLEAAIQCVYEEDRLLLKFDNGDRIGLEQAFVFRTGIHLSNLLKDTVYEALDMDSEYNKYHGKTKTSNRFPKGVRPDLIIHKRDSNDENKLVVEFKGWWKNNIERDIRKLEDLTNTKDRYNYLIGIFVHIGKTSAKFRCFIKGNEYE